MIDPKRVIRNAMLAAMPLQTMDHQSAVIVAALTERLGAGLAAATRLILERLGEPRLPGDWRQVQQWIHEEDYIVTRREGEGYVLTRYGTSFGVFPTLSEAIAAADKARAG